MKNYTIKLLVILAIENVFLLIHIVSPIVAEYFVNSKIEWLGNVIFFILSIVAIYFIFLQTINKGEKNDSW